MLLFCKSNFDIIVKVYQEMGYCIRVWKRKNKVVIELKKYWAQLIGPMKWNALKWILKKIQNHDELDYDLYSTIYDDTHAFVVVCVDLSQESI